MKLAKLVRKNDDYSIDTGDIKIWTLAYLLRTDVGSDTKSIYDFLEDDKLIAFCGNVSYIEKEGIDLIIDLEWHDYDDKCPNKIIISKENFLNILDQWEEVYSQKPDEIIIQQYENGKISITGKFID